MLSLFSNSSKTPGWNETDLLSYQFQFSLRTVYCADVFILHLDLQSDYVISSETHTAKLYQWTKCLLG